MTDTTVSLRPSPSRLRGRWQSVFCTGTKGLLDDCEQCRDWRSARALPALLPATLPAGLVRA